MKKKSNKTGLSFDTSQLCCVKEVTAEICADCSEVSPQAVCGEIYSFMYMLKSTIIYIMKNWKFPMIFLATGFIIIVVFVLFYSKKESDPPKPLLETIDVPTQAPVESSKADVDNIKNEPESRKNEKQIVQVKKRPLKKPASTVLPPDPYAKTQKFSLIIDIKRLNKEFKSYGLNVWASEFKNNEILLNGYVKNENERKAALLIAKRYNSNITDMINNVRVHSIEGSENDRIHQPLPLSNYPQKNR